MEIKNNVILVEARNFQKMMSNYIFGAASPELKNEMLKNPVCNKLDKMCALGINFGDLKKFFGSSATSSASSSATLSATSLEKGGRMTRKTRKTGSTRKTRKTGRRKTMKREKVTTKKGRKTTNKRSRKIDLKRANN